jgi:uncharacterized Rossmann fold enzyme
VAKEEEETAEVKVVAEREVEWAAEMMEAVMAAEAREAEMAEEVKEAKEEERVAVVKVAAKEVAEMAVAMVAAVTEVAMVVAEMEGVPLDPDYRLHTHSTDLWHRMADSCRILHLCTNWVYVSMLRNCLHKNQQGFLHCPNRRRLVEGGHLRRMHSTL